MGFSLTTKLSRVMHWSAMTFLTGMLAIIPFATAWGVSDEGGLDCRLTLKARQALLKEPALEKLNLGVSVRSNAATLWGDVTDRKLARHAEEVVRKVPGILTVRNDVRIAPPDDPVGDFVQNHRLSSPASPRVAQSHRPPATLTSQPPEPVKSSELAVTLLPPTALPAAEPAHVVPAAKPDDLSSTVEKLTRSDPRFRGLRPEIDGGIVRLRGSAGRWADVMELAQLISRLGGVERVILQDVRSSQ
jgi:BON domain-containing protein